MEDSVLSFLKAEWKVSDTGSAHWASSLPLQMYMILFLSIQMYVEIFTTTNESGTFYTFTNVWHLIYHYKCI
jgi:hypothetical protein